jgi:hypothetical protein
MRAATPATSSRAELRSLVGTLLIITGGLLWFAASHAHLLSGSLSLPLLALGCALYLAAGRIVVDTIYEDIVGEPLFEHPSRTRWWNWPDAIALVGLAAWANTKGSWYVALALVLCLLAFVAVHPRPRWAARLEMRAEHVAAALWTSLHQSPWGKRAIGFGTAQLVSFGLD